MDYAEERIGNVNYAGEKETPARSPTQKEPNPR